MPLGTDVVEYSACPSKKRVRHEQSRRRRKLEGGRQKVAANTTKEGQEIATMVKSSSFIREGPENARERLGVESS